MLLVFAIEFVTMTVAFADFGLSVDLVGKRIRLDLAGPRAQTHGAAQFFHAAQFAQFVDHAMRSGRIEFAGVGVRQAADIARKFNARRLHAKANAEVRNLVLARIADGLEHAFDAALAEAAGHEDAVVVFELRLVTARRLLSRPSASIQFTMQFQVVRQRAVDQRFFQGLVRVFVLDVLADDGDGDFVLRVVHAMDNVFPLLQVAVFGIDVQILRSASVSTSSCAKTSGTS